MKEANVHCYLIQLAGCIKVEPRHKPHHHNINNITFVLIVVKSVSGN